VLVMDTICFAVSSSDNDRAVKQPSRSTQLPHSVSAVTAEMIVQMPAWSTVAHAMIVALSGRRPTRRSPVDIEPLSISMASQSSRRGPTDGSGVRRTLYFAWAAGVPLYLEKKIGVFVGAPCITAAFWPIPMTAAS
jgi:hypothetical protein